MNEHAELIAQLREARERRLAAVAILKARVSEVEPVDSSAARKLRHGYGAELTDARLATLLESLDRKS